MAPPPSSPPLAATPATATPTAPKRQSLALEFLTSSLGVATATTITQPIDLVKTRMQLELLQQQHAAASPSAAGAARPAPAAGTGLFATAAGVVRREGALALWGGAAPAAVRGMSYGGLRLGLYGPIRDAMAAAQAQAPSAAPAPSSSSSASPSAPSSSSSAPASFGTKLAAGAVSGGLAAAVTSPTELVKVRMQAVPTVVVAVATQPLVRAAASSSSSSGSAPAAGNAPKATTTTTTTAPRSAPPLHHHHHHHHHPQHMPAGLAGMACSAPSAAASSSPSSGGGGGGGGGAGGAMRALSSSSSLSSAASAATAGAAARREGGLARCASIVRQVVAEDGVRGLWRGATPGMIRAAVLTASQCATYDAAKRRLAALSGLPDDSLALQTGCALLTGLASTTATQPVDVIKTHMFVTRKGAGGGAGSSGGIAATARAIWRANGASGFLRGWTANYARLGPMTVLIFTTTELLRGKLGMGAL